MRKSLSILLLSLAVTVPSFATAIEADRWYSIESDVTINPFPGSSSEPTYYAAGTPPWSFTLLSAGILRFTDNQIVEEAYRIYDGSIDPANLLGYTGQRNRDFDANCLLDPRFAMRTQATVLPVSPWI